MKSSRFLEPWMSRLSLWFISVFTLCLGTVIIYGWLTQNLNIIQINPSFPPMQFNTATCFLFIGLAVLFFLFNKTIFSILAASIVWIIALFTLAEYLFHINLGLDQFVTSYTPPGVTVFPGRMALNTATCFFLVGCSLFLLNLRHRPFLNVLVQLMSAVIAAITFVALLGYATGFSSLIGWADFIGMAFHTALGLFFIGLGLFVYYFFLKSRRSKISWGSLIAVAFFSVTITLMFLQSFQTQEYLIVQKSSMNYAEYIANDLSAYLQETSRALKRQAQRFTIFGVDNKAMWIKESNAFLEDFKWLLTLSLYNDKFQLQEMASKIAAPYRASQQELEQFTAKRQSSFLNGKNLILLFPLANPPAGDKGTLVAEIDVDSIVKSTLPELLLTNYAVSIFNSDILVYKDSNIKPVLVGKEALVEIDATRSHGTGNWRIQVLPTEKVVTENQTFLPNIILMTGIIATLFSVIVVVFIQFALYSKRSLARALQEKEEALAFRQAILESSAYSVIATDTSGKIRFFNKAAEKLLGYSAHEMIGKCTPEVFHDKEEVIKRAQELSISPGFDVFVEVSKRGMHEEREWIHIHKNGTRIPVMLSVTLLKDLSGKVIGYLGIAYDITQIKEAERMKNELIAITSHELRSPLTAIKGAIDLLVASTDQQPLLEIARSNCNRLLRIVSDILDIQKMEAGKMEFIFTDIPLTVFISHALDANKILAMGKEIKLQVQEPVPEVVIHGDEDRLLQVMANLLSNAIKHTPHGGVISLTFSQHDHCIRVGIKDQGAGIPEKFLRNLFQKFYQVPGPEKKGTGLGLSIAKAIIEKHGGNIGVESSPQGSTFWFELPC